MNYYITQCKHCGNWRVLLSKAIKESSFKCFHCNRGMKVNQTINLIGPVERAEAPIRCQRLNARRGR